MPRKLALAPKNLKKRYMEVRERYGQDIFSKASNLYHFCFFNMHSYQIMNLKKKVKKAKAKANFPFISGGEREWPMIYTFLLSELLKDHYQNYWELLENELIYLALKKRKLLFRWTVDLPDT